MQRGSLRCLAWSVRRQPPRVLTKTEPFPDHCRTIAGPLVRAIACPGSTAMAASGGSQQGRWPWVHRPSTGRAVHQHAHDDVGYRHRVRTADGLPDHACETCPQAERRARNCRGVAWTDGMRFRVAVTCGGTPRGRQGVREAPGLQQRCAPAQDGILTPPKDLHQDGTHVMIGRTPHPPPVPVGADKRPQRIPERQHRCTRLPMGDDAATILRASACLLLPSHPYSTSRGRHRLRREAVD
jgi:hypothetical protein